MPIGEVTRVCGNPSVRGSGIWKGGGIRERERGRESEREREREKA